MNAPDTVVSRAMCVVHPATSATMTCPRCGRFGCDGCLAGRTLCRECASQILSMSPISGRARVASAALLATVGVKAMLVLLELAAALSAPGATARARGLFSFVEIGVGLATVITFLIWMYTLVSLTRAFRLDVGDPPIAAVLWWFLPLANLVKPYSILRQSLVELRSEAAVDDARLAWWWGLWIGGNLVGFTYRSNGQVLHSTMRAVLSLLLTGIAAYLGSRMIGVMQAAVRAYATPEAVEAASPLAEHAPSLAANG